jgi:hypothetical protein
VGGASLHANVAVPTRERLLKPGIFILHLQSYLPLCLSG